MNNVLLKVVDQSSGGSYHIKLFIDEKEAGIFYLNEEQFDFFVKSLKSQSLETGIVFSVENPFDVDSDEEEEFFSQE